MPITRSNEVTLDGSYELVHFTVNKLPPTSPIEGTKLTAKFENGKLSGNGGINNYTASYKPSKDNPPSQLSISELTPAKVGGPPNVMDQEHRFFEGLRAASDITYGDGKITLMWDSGRNSLVFRRL